MSEKQHSKTMEKILKEAREKMKDMIRPCTDAEKQMFIRMYGYKSAQCFKTLEETIDTLPEEKIDRVFQQIEATLEKKVRKSD